jgi:molybdopterin-guanine dinucleotide biosynthesis protein
MRVINLIGAPGSGKSTLAHDLVAAMSKKGMSVEYVSEYAKILTWKDRMNTLKGHQTYIFEKQADMYFYLEKQVDYIVTDSPLLLSSYYGKKFDNLPECWFDYVFWKVNKYNNINVMMKRNHPYVENGRNQNEDESDVMGDEICQFMDGLGQPYKTLLSDDDKNIDKVLKILND